MPTIPVWRIKTTWLLRPIVLGLQQHSHRLNSGFRTDQQPFLHVLLQTTTLLTTKILSSVPLGQPPFYPTGQCALHVHPQRSLHVHAHHSMSTPITPLSATLDGPRSTQFYPNNSPSIQPNLDSTPSDVDKAFSSPLKRTSSMATGTTTMGVTTALQPTRQHPISVSSRLISIVGRDLQTTGMHDFISVCSPGVGSRWRGRWIGRGLIVVGHSRRIFWTTFGRIFNMEGQKSLTVDLLGP